MTHLIEVSFKGNRRQFFQWEGETPPAVSASIIVESDRGEDLGRVHATGELAERRAKGVPHRPTEGEELSKARRLASSGDVARLNDLRQQDELARRQSMEKVRAHNLQMKISDAEWRWDRKKLTLYFTADKRVDFRELVRDLATQFRTRIELKQIGVRDEAKRLDGIGRCGRQYCSSSWLPELRPVNLGVAKDQRLSLNPSQISGACGRLMCCLRYEHEHYVEARRRFPKEGKVITTARGEERVQANDIFRERVTLRNAEGEFRVVTLADLRREAPGSLPVSNSPEEDTPAIAHYAYDEEVIRMEDTAERPAYRPDFPPPVTPKRPPLPTVSEPPTQRERPQRPQRPERARTDRRRDETPRDGDDRRRQGERRQRDDRRPQGGRQERTGPRPQSPAGAAPNTPPPASQPNVAGGEGADAAGSPRRRRGRRGGRRGRGPRGERPNGGDAPASGTGEGA